MQNFLAVYLGRPDSPQRKDWDRMDDAARQKRMEAGMKAWGDWMMKHHAAVVVEGGPLGKTKSASAGGLADTANNMTGYVVIRAESHEAAARLFEGHPHFAIFPGESIDIMPALPIPGR